MRTCGEHFPSAAWAGKRPARFARGDHLDRPHSAAVGEGGPSSIHTMAGAAITVGRPLVAFPTVITPVAPRHTLPSRLEGRRACCDQVAQQDRCCVAGLAGLCRDGGCQGMHAG